MGQEAEGVTELPPDATAAAQTSSTTTEDMSGQLQAIEETHQKDEEEEVPGAPSMTRAVTMGTTTAKVPGFSTSRKDELDDDDVREPSAPFRLENSPSSRKRREEKSSRMGNWINTLRRKSSGGLLGNNSTSNGSTRNSNSTRRGMNRVSRRLRSSNKQSTRSSLDSSGKGGGSTRTTSSVSDVKQQLSRERRDRHAAARKSGPIVTTPGAVFVSNNNNSDDDMMETTESSLTTLKERVQTKNDKNSTTVSDRVAKRRARGGAGIGAATKPGAVGVSGGGATNLKDDQEYEDVKPGAYQSTTTSGNTKDAIAAERRAQRETRKADKVTKQISSSKYQQEFLP